MSAGTRPLRHVTLRHMMGVAPEPPASGPDAHTGPMDDGSADKFALRRGGRGRSKARRVERRSQGRRAGTIGAGAQLAPTDPPNSGGESGVDEALDAYEGELASRGPMMSCADRVDWLSRWD